MQAERLAASGPSSCAFSGSLSIPPIRRRALYSKRMAAEPTEVLTAIDAARNLDGVMAAIRKHARHLVRADGVTFVLREQGFCFYADEDAVSPLWKGQRFPMETCVSGWVMDNRKPAVIPDIYADKRIPAEVYRKTFVKSLAMVPVGNFHSLAAIGAYWAKPHTASRQQVQRLQLLAGAAADVLEQTCPKCHRRGFVRFENVIKQGTGSRHNYCGACEHTWVTW